MDRRTYMAYGSNLNVPQMRWRCPHAAILGTATLQGWELLFKGSRTGSYLTIEKYPGGIVPVVLWEVDASDEAALDRYEGYPRFYCKKDFLLGGTCIVGPLANRRFVGERRSSEVSELLSLRESERYGTCDDEVVAFAYVMHEDRPVGVPTDYYLKICLEGYDTFGFDRNILIRAYEKCREMCDHER